MQISIIIPTYNEAKHIQHLVTHLKSHADERLREVIVIDGGSNDETVALSEKSGAKVCLCLEPDRAKQMNCGAMIASGEILHFIHADTIPPTTFLNDIENAVLSGYPMGCYRSCFDSEKALLKFNAWLTRFKYICFRGGDQTLFITKKVFNDLHGYDENYTIMEEYDLLRRAKKKYRFKILDKGVLISARKYDNNSYLKVNVANALAMFLFLVKCKPEMIKKIYIRLLNSYSFGELKSVTNHG